jgi:hypothetical protein
MEFVLLFYVDVIAIKMMHTVGYATWSRCAELFPSYLGSFQIELKEARILASRNPVKSCRTKTYQNGGLLAQ